MYGKPTNVISDANSYQRLQHLKRQAFIEFLIQKIARLKTQHRQSLATQILTEFTATRQQVLKMVSTKLCRAFTYRSGLNWKSANKTRTLLARALQKTCKQTRVHYILTPYRVQGPVSTHNRESFPWLLPVSLFGGRL